MVVLIGKLRYNINMLQSTIDRVSVPEVKIDVFGLDGITLVTLTIKFTANMSPEMSGAAAR